MQFQFVFVWLGLWVKRVMYHGNWAWVSKLQKLWALLM